LQCCSTLWSSRSIHRTGIPLMPHLIALETYHIYGVGAVTSVTCQWRWCVDWVMESAVVRRWPCRCIVAQRQLRGLCSPGCQFGDDRAYATFSASSENSWKIHWSTAFSATGHLTSTTFWLEVSRLNTLDNSFQHGQAFRWDDVSGRRSLLHSWSKFRAGQVCDK